MRILFENHHYDKHPFSGDGVPSLEDVLTEGRISAKHVEGDTKLSVDYVGYFYSRSLKDCVFILPNVLLDENGKVLGKKVDPTCEGYDPTMFLNIDRDGASEIEKDMLSFVYEFSLWVYRAIDVYRHRKPDSDIAVNPEITQMGRGRRRDRYTFVDVVLALLDFNKKNQDYLTFILKNIHRGHNKINWTKTIAQNRVIIQEDIPVYYQPVNKKKQVNYDEELLIIYYSILNHIHEKYNFPVRLNANFDLITGQRFEQYIKGAGKRRLKQIKYKYFSDRDLEIWNLCYAFFDMSYKVAILCDKKDYLLVHDFPAVFEDMVDALLSDEDKELDKMKVQEDDKRMDHLYRYRGLTELEDKVYYIGDSKYYARGHKITDEAIAKQYTYARNLVQYNLDLFHSDKEEEKAKAQIYRDADTEGYDIVPNFFISAIIDDISSNGYNDSRIEYKPTAQGERFYVSYHFKNRLFDRDTILVAHYNVNFLFVISLYAKNRKTEQEGWSEKVKDQFRREIIAGLNEEFQFYALAPKPTTYAKGYVEENFKSLLGKIFTPFKNDEMYVLALEKPKDEQQTEANGKYVEELKKSFFVTEPEEYQIGEDPVNMLTKKGYTKGLLKPQRKEEKMIVFTIDKDVNKDILALTKGTAKEFFSGYKPNLMQDFSNVKYLSPFDGEPLKGAYRIKSMELTSVVVKGETSIRIRFDLEGYRIFKQPIGYGLHRYAHVGHVRSPKDIASLIGDNTPYMTFDDLFEE